MNRLISIVIAILLGVSVLSAQNYFHGTLTEDTKWSGTVYIDGDVTVPSNVRLQIEPGTKIIVSPNKDVLSKGKDKQKVDIIIKGGFVAKGTPEARIVFTSGSDEPMMADWYGIIIKSKTNICILDFVTIEYAYFGLNIINSKPIIKNCEIRYNYYAGINVDFKAEPIISGCAITANDYAGIKCDYGAKPVVSECIISQNSHGVISFKQAEPNLGKIERDGKVVGGNNRIFENWDYNIYNHTNSTIYAQNNNWLTKNNLEIEKTIYDKIDDAKSGDVIYIPLYKESAKIVPVLAVVPQNVRKTAAEKADSLQKEKLRKEQETIIADAAIVKQKLLNDQINKDVEKKPDETPKEIVETETKTDEVVKPVIQEKIPEKVEVKKELTAEEKIHDDILSLRKPALKYLLDNKQIKRTKEVPVEYPSSYKASRRSGRVILRVVIDVSGRVESASILKVTGGEEFGKVALEAVKQFEYSVGKFKGQPVRYIKNELLTFSL